MNGDFQHSYFSFDHISCKDVQEDEHIRSTSSILQKYFLTFLESSGVQINPEIMDQ